uniref:C2 domain-containing protein n=1 Tax=Fagus sylvatica TaxID=28930 RepID=A0A2N9GVK6_FAGSY
MRLYVYVLEGKDLSVKDSYVKIQVGKHKSKTRILRNTHMPIWNEEFVFSVHDTDEELVVSLFRHDDEPRVFHGSRDLVGRVRIPAWSIAAEENHTLPPTWFALEKPKSGKFISEDCGKIFLTSSLHGKGHDALSNQLHYAHSNVNIEDPKELEGSRISSQDIFSSKAPSRKIAEGKHLMKAVASSIERLFNKNEEASRNDDSTEMSRNNGQEMPENLQGGILLDQIYAVPSYDLNALLFAPDSQFRKDLAELQGTIDVQEGPWIWKSGDTSCLTRVVSYTKAATKLVKTLKATEEQTYIRADGGEFAVLVSVSTPEAPFGNTFKVELLYKIMSGPAQSSGEEASHLVLSWGINFLQNTMMREHQSDWDLATEYLWNLTVVSTIVIVLYVLVHILLSEPGKIQGLEFNGLDLPDSIGEIITCGILVIQLERVFNMITHFIQARFQRGSDHGVKAQGDGWVLTIALIEGINLASLESTEFSGPYVVFTCNGKTRTSSVQLQTRDPQWNEILEFDAMEEPPSVLDVEVFDFDGPFDQTTSLGHAEINFVTHTSTELAGHFNLRSPHRNSTFQKLFGLPPEEFLISDYTCSLKRKMPLQDIEDIQVLPPTLSTVGSPSLVLVLRKGRGLDARHGAKSQDEEGRLKFYFQSFVSFNVASRTIMALWRMRTLTPDQKAQILEEQEDQDERSIMLEDAGSIMDAEDAGSILDAEGAKMSKIYTAELPINIKSLMEVFDGGKLEHKIMGKSGCLNYATTTWEPVKPDVYERRWIVNEVMALHGVPFGNHFRVHFRYQIEKSALAHCTCRCDAYMGITWLKSTMFQQRITQNITEKFTHRLKEIFEFVEREILFTTHQDSSI